MPLSDNQLDSIVNAQLTTAERAGAIVYALLDSLPSGTKLQFPHLDLDMPWDALLAFVDREPRANWGHSCRYLLINRDTGEVRSKEARFPPFRPDSLRSWRVVYQAPGTPDNLSAVPSE